MNSPVSIKNINIPYLCIALSLSIYYNIYNIYTFSQIKSYLKGKFRVN